MKTQPTHWIVVALLACGALQIGCGTSDLDVDEALAEETQQVGEPVDEAPTDEAPVPDTEPVDGLEPLTTSDCDPWIGEPAWPCEWVAADAWKFSHAGRAVHLVSGRCSEQSYVRIASGYQQGDRVWTDRRVKGASSWRQCGPFSAKKSGVQNHWNIGNKVFEVRACIDPAGSTQFKCGKWWNGSTEL